MKKNLYNFNKPKFDLIRKNAYELLLSQEKPHFGMRAERIEIPGKKLVFSSLQEYSLLTNKTMMELTSNGKLSLGCHINISNNIYLLLHNADINSEQCENWTNIHEIGHIQESHLNNGDKEEVEAHFFAACFLMPDAPIRYLKAKGCVITKHFLMKYFNVSADAANKKIATMSIGDFATDYDDDLINALKHDIDFVLKDALATKTSYINFAALNF